MKKIVLVLLLGIVVVAIGAFVIKGNLQKSNGSPSPTASPKTVSIYLVALGDDGKSGKKIGCGDSLVSVQREVRPTSDLLRTALEELLSLKNQQYGESGFMTALANSQIAVGNIQ